MPEKKYIEVNAVKHELVQLVNIAYGYEGIDEEIEEILERLPAADVQPVVHAHWNKEPWLIGTTHRCCLCGYNYGTPYKYCPNCGAKMDGGAENGD